MKLLVVGATGLVGRSVIAQAIASGQFTQVTCLVRREPDAPVAGAIYEVCDFATLSDDMSAWRADAIIIALGTTIAKAGSQAAFEAVDLDLVVTCAAFARGAGVERAAVVSSLGADVHSSNFYLMVKGRMESGVKELEFPSLAIVRPSLLAGDRDEKRLGESIGLMAAKLFWPLIPRKYRAVPAEKVAATLIQSVTAGAPGSTTIESDEIWRMTQ